MQLTNQWNRIVYRLWAPVYDQTVNRVFLPGRTRALELLCLQPAERVLIVGVGTGADLPLLPPGISAVGTDLSREMLTRARLQAERCAARIQLIQADAQLPLLDDGLFDAAILSLVLSVVPDGNACLRATLRALKPGARAVVFDKFLPEGSNPSGLRQFTNAFSTVLGTDINRKLSDLMQGCPCELVSNEASIGGGLYRVALIRRTQDLGSG